MGVRFALALVASGAIAAGCGTMSDDDGDGAGLQGSAASTPRPIVVTRNPGSAPPMCEPRRVGRRLINFSRALRRADASTLQRFLGSRGFVAFVVAYDKGKDREIFEIRSRDYERGLAALRRMGGLRLRFNEVASAGRNGFAFEGTYRAEGSPRNEPLFGKGGWSCKGPGLIQAGVVVATSKPFNVVRCPEPRRHLKGALVVCSRRI